MSKRGRQISNTDTAKIRHNIKHPRLPPKDVIQCVVSATQKTEAQDFETAWAK
jgi:hypothetical protein